MWTCSVTLDPDKADVGTAHASFNDTDATVFNYSARVQITAGARDAFIQEAIALRNAWQTRKAAEAGYKTNLENRFTQLDV